MIKVVNRHRSKDAGMYIGRGTVWGNPYEIGKDGDRAEVVQKYRARLRREWLAGRELKEELLKLVTRAKHEDLVFICSCKPQLCHGDVLKDVIETLIAKGY